MSCPVRIPRFVALVRFGRRSRVVRSLLACALVVLSAGCDSTSSTATGPTAIKCQVALEGLSQSIESSGGLAELAVRTQPECAWTAASEAGWISSLTPAAGQGNGQIQIRVPANPLPSARQGDIVVNGNRAAVRQAAAPCRFDVSPRAFSVDARAEAGTVTVVAATGCSWIATSDSEWLQVTTTAGNGNGSVGFSVAANAGGERAASLTIAGETVTVTQRPADVAGSCTYELTPTNQFVPVGGSPANQISVATQPACPWTVTNGVPWIAVTGGASGQGNGSVVFSVAANTGASRTATLSVGGRPFNVTQAGVTPCAYNVGPTSQTVSAAGGSGESITVSTAAGCAWTASSNASWLTITGGSTGSGNGVVSFTAASNSGGERSATLTVAGTTITVTQGAAAPAPAPSPTPAPTPTPTPPPAPPPSPPAPCTYSISSPSQSVGSLGGAGTPVAVTTTAACSWTATSNVSWMSITSGASGTGNGSVAFTVDINAGGQRSGTLTIAGQTFTVTQAAVTVPCSYSLAPTQQAVGAAGGTGSTVVSTSAACAWTASSNASWITITSGGTGLGSGTVAFSVAGNSGGARSGTLTIGGQTFTVSQAAAPVTCTYAINPTSESMALLGGPGRPVSVTAPAGCGWTATSNASWITVTSGASGSGNGTVEYSVALLLLGSRTGTITIAGQTLTVTQSGVLP